MNWTSFIYGAGVVIALLVVWGAEVEMRESDAAEESWQSIMDLERGEGR